MMLYSWPSHLLTTVVVFLLMLNFDKVQPIYFVCCEIGQFLSIFWLRKNKIKGEGREVTNFVRTLTKWMAGVEIWLAKRPEPQESLGDPSETLEVWEAQDSAYWPLSQWQSAANLISFKLYTAKLLKHETDPIKGINRKTAKDILISEQFQSCKNLKCRNKTKDNMIIVCSNPVSKLHYNEYVWSENTQSPSNDELVSSARRQACTWALLRLQYFPPFFSQ